MNKKLRTFIQDLSHCFDEEDERAFALWTWLPSYRETCKHHPNTYHNYVPSISDVLYEATIYINFIVNKDHYTDEELDNVKQWFDEGYKSTITKRDYRELDDWFSCCCDEDYYTDNNNENSEITIRKDV